MRAMHSRILAAASAILLVPMLLAAGDTASIADRSVGGNRPMGRHFILEAQHPLSTADLADLAAQGVTVQKAVSGGRYLIVVEPDSTFDATDLRVRSIQPLTAAQKLQPSAYREMARPGAFARIQVDFNKDVSIDQARQALVDAGGSAVDLLRPRFGPLRRLDARIPAADVAKLAADERVLSVYGGPPLRAEVDNATAAVMSNVTPLFSAPYGLTGNGVVLSLFELGVADAAHNEFSGRLTVHGSPYCSNCSDFANHATHVSGTLIAMGQNPQAKGMAPAATLHEYKGGGTNWLDDKDSELPVVKSVADNNSWGYVLGWRSNSNTGWEWTGNDEYIGGYDSTDSAIDEIARGGVTLMIHSAGNEGDNGGPTLAPFQHEHEDDNGDTIPNEIFCYSVNGSGTDCPLPCTASPGHCEITRHPVHVPYGSLGLTPGSKNVVAVGAVDNFKNILSFSSRGPTRDGRVKPDVVAKGYNLYSTFPNNGYARSSGTSMSSPVVTGLSALIVEQFRKSFGFTPDPQTLKTLIMAGADDLGNPGIDYTYGYGLADAKASVDLVIADSGSGKRIQVDSAAQGSQFDYPLTLAAGQNLRVVLGWQDPEVLNLGDDLAGNTLVNDLDLKVTGPAGTVLPYVLDKSHPDANATRGVNTVDNSEEVEIAGATAGSYHIIVTGTRITASSPQDFVVVSNADISSGVVVPPCVDPTEPNDTSSTAFGPLATATPVLARLCSAGDSDFFRFSSSGSGGQIKAAATATDTGLHLALLSSTGSELASTDIAPGTTGQVTATAAAGTQQFFIRITASGAVGSDGSYTVTATYPFSLSTRRRTAR
jgi:hypothetical protein